MLRNHLMLIEKYQHQNHLNQVSPRLALWVAVLPAADHHCLPPQVDPNSADTQRLYLETRFEQLRVASDLELWQEAYVLRPPVMEGFGRG